MNEHEYALFLAELKARANRPVGRTVADAMFGINDAIVGVVHAFTLLMEDVFDVVLPTVEEFAKAADRFNSISIPLEEARWTK